MFHGHFEEARPTTPHGSANARTVITSALESFPRARVRKGSSSYAPEKSGKYALDRHSPAPTVQAPERSKYLLLPTFSFPQQPTVIISICRQLRMIFSDSQSVAAMPTFTRPYPTPSATRPGLRLSVKVLPCPFFTTPINYFPSFGVACANPVLRIVAQATACMGCVR